MSKICCLCRSIPIETLPALQPYWSNAELSAGIYAYVFKSPDDGAPSKALFQHHSNASHLEDSATSCRICETILDGVTNFTAKWDKAPKTAGYFEPPLPNFEQVWLINRADGAGFRAVLQAVSRNVLYLVASIRMVVPYGDDLATVIPGRPISRTACSESTLALASGWIRRCVQQHTGCARSQSPQMPTRLLDVMDGPALDGIRLRGDLEYSARYLTLSYCWGSGVHFTTTTETLNTRETSILYEHLPKTFQDAVTLTRYLGIRYLWIDSLCIIQDSRKDWEMESSRMAQIYENSYLTISVAHGSDTSAGCFNTRNIASEDYISFPYISKEGLAGSMLASIEDIRETWQNEITLQLESVLKMEDEPISQRGWTFQERELSPRLLHFATKQLYFECSEGFHGENGFESNSKNSVYSKPVGIEHQLAGDDESLKLARWHVAVMNYSRRKWTRISDKLPALSGLARRSATELQDDYVAGLWKRSLIFGLMWIKLPIRKSPASSEYLAPSWSWVAANGPVSLSGLLRSSRLRRVAEVLAVEMVLKGEDEYGEVTGGWLRLRAPVVNVCVPNGSKCSTNQPSSYADMRAVDSRWRYVIPCLDDFDHRCETDVLELTKKELFVIIIVRDSETQSYEGLVVTWSDESKGAYKRLGTCELILHSNEVAQRNMCWQELLIV